MNAGARSLPNEARLAPCCQQSTLGLHGDRLGFLTIFSLCSHHLLALFSLADTAQCLIVMSRKSRQVL